jgi:ABC-2 type transport system ATP-binding protein
MRGGGARQQVRVRTPDTGLLAGALLRSGLRVQPTGDGELLVEGATAETVGDTALRIGAAVHRLAEERSSLEQVYLDLTGDSVQYRVVSEPTPAGQVRR